MSEKMSEHNSKCLQGIIEGTFSTWDCPFHESTLKCSQTCGKLWPILRQYDLFGNGITVRVICPCDYFFDPIEAAKAAVKHGIFHSTENTIVFHGINWTAPEMSSEQMMGRLDRIITSRVTFTLPKGKRL